MIGTATAQTSTSGPNVNTAPTRKSSAATSAPKVSHFSCCRSRPCVRRRRSTIETAPRPTHITSRGKPMSRNTVKSSPAAYWLSVG
jgi:hypothetical protein